MVTIFSDVGFVGVTNCRDSTRENIVEVVYNGPMGGGTCALLNQLIYNSIGLWSPAPRLLMVPLMHDCASYWLLHFFSVCLFVCFVFVFCWVKLLIMFMFSGILKPFYLSFVSNMIKWFCFLQCMNREEGQIKALALYLMLVQCWPRAVDVSKFNVRALDLSHFTRKSKYRFVNF